MKELKQEIIELLLSKTKAVVDEYRLKWEEDLAVLFSEKRDLDTLEAHKAELMSEYSKLRPLVNKELERRNNIDRGLHKLNKTIVITRKKINELTERLTVVEAFDYPSPMLNFISGDTPPSYIEMIKTKTELSAERAKLKKGK